MTCPKGARRKRKKSLHNETAETAAYVFAFADEPTLGDASWLAAQWNARASAGAAGKTGTVLALEA